MLLEPVNAGWRIPGEDTPVLRLRPDEFQPGRLCHRLSEGVSILALPDGWVTAQCREEKSVKGKIALSVAVIVALGGGTAGAAVTSASAASTPKCRVSGSTLTGESFAASKTFTISPGGKSVRSSSNGRIGPTTVTGQGPFSVGSVACIGPVASSAQAAAVLKAGTAAAQAAVQRGAPRRW